MSLKNGTNSVNSPQILNFPVEKQPRQLSIHIENEEIGLLYKEYFSFVYLRCSDVLGNKEDALDAAQEVFVKIQELKSNGGLKILYPKTFFSTAAKNTGLNNKKKTMREYNKLYDMATNSGINWFKNIDEGQGHEKWEAGIIDNGYEQVEAEIIVKAILKEQDETTRKIYFYKYHDNMQLEQIGKLIGFSKSAVHKKIKALEEQVKTALGRQGK